MDLSGLWKFRVDRDDSGERRKFYQGFDSDIEIAVPGSWNEQLEELGLLHYTGSAWYSTRSFIPDEYEGRQIWLRIGSADYHSAVWVNGVRVGENHAGFLPFQFDITGHVTPGEEASIVIRVNNVLNNGTIPQGITSEIYQQENRLREETFPPTRFDFSPFGGLHRPVVLFTVPHQHIEGVHVATKLLKNGKASVSITVTMANTLKPRVRATISAGAFTISSETAIVKNKAMLEMEVDRCVLWEPGNPFLYDLEVRLVHEGGFVDEYSMPIGIREIKVARNALLLNGKKIFLRGFGKHEDFWGAGKGLFLPLVVKDFHLLKWINANSFRTSHYPYAEEVLQYADRHGILIIDEVPAVSIDIRYVTGETIDSHKESISRLIARDGNHPCVIMWAIGNEPNLAGAEQYFDGSGRAYWKEMFEHARRLDASRPITVPNCQRAGIDDPVFEFSDVLCINRYYGWYENPGQLDKALSLMEKEMDALHKKYKRPVCVTEFGADAVAGMHSTSDQMFTEEYQAKFLEMYIRLIESKPYTVGEHVWNFADFRTPQHFRRVVMNLKGVFTRSREPKQAAFMLKQLWSKTR